MCIAVVWHIFNKCMYLPRVCLLLNVHVGWYGRLISGDINFT